MNCCWKRAGLKLELLGLLPEELLLVSAKVAVGGGLVVDRGSEVEGSHEHAGAQVEVVLDDLRELGVGLDAGAVGVDEDRQGLGDADGVRELDEAALAQLRGDERLRDPAGGVRARAVDLGRVLAGERATAVCAPAAVRVDDDLAPGEPGVALRPADDEAAGRVQVVDGLVVEVLGGDDGLDDVLHQDLVDGLVGHVGVVLRRDDDGVHAHGGQVRALLLVLDGDLRLGVRAHPLVRPGLADLREALHQLGGEHVGQRHHLLGLVGGVAEHVTLVARASVVLVLTGDAVADVGGLLLDGDQDGAGLVIDALGAVVVADLLDGVSDDLLVVEVRLGSDLAEHHDHAGLGAGLAGDAGLGVFLQAGVEDGV